ncbi:hypothetical protein ACSLOP_30600, partial [Escherichia coli]|uniref:hypothetical protein n=1 Tax=Escherichia coli TaxID=562 RepID=UPI003EE017F5
MARIALERNGLSIFFKSPTNSISKPFDEWLEMQLQDIGDPEKLIEMLNEEINEEIIMKIMSL